MAATKKRAKKPTQPAAEQAGVAVTPEVRQQRVADFVRRYIRHVHDDNTKGSLRDLARDWELPIKDMRSFRDGSDKAISKSVITAMAKVLGSDAMLSGQNYSDDDALMMPGSINWKVDQDRLESYKQFDLICKVRPEAKSACHAWADLGITGGVGEPTSRRFFAAEYRGTDKAVKTALDEITAIIYLLMPNDVKLQAFAGMCKYGDQWGEIGLEETRPGQWDIGQLVARHPRTMFVNRDDEGNVDPRKSYFQKLPDVLEPNAYFPGWKIARFANIEEWGGIYGTSIFDSNLRSFIKIEAMECSMIIRRMTRAPMRYHRILDVGMVDPSKAGDVLKARKVEQTKTRTLSYDAKRGLKAISAPPEEDFWTAKASKDSPADIVPLQGDAHLAEIADFLHFWKVWLSGLGPPSAHLGYEGDTMRSVITDLHIVFARKVRRMQLKFIAGLNHIYWVGLILRGIDPRTVDYLIVPPTMGTRDELVRAQVMQTYATTIKYLSDAAAKTGKQPSIAWFLRYIMGLNPEAIEALDLEGAMQKVIDPKSVKKKNDPASGLASSDSNSDDALMAAEALKSDEVAKQATYTAFLLGERAIAMSAEKYLDITGHPFHQRQLAAPIENMSEVCGLLGRPYLRRIA